MSNRAGFTLLEVLIVVVIAVSVTAFAVPAYKKAQARSSYLAATGILQDVWQAVLSYQTELLNEDKNPYLPTSQQQIVLANQLHPNEGIDSGIESSTAYVSNLFNKGYLQPIPLDQEKSQSYKNYMLYVCGPHDSSSLCCTVGGNDAVACMELVACSGSSYYPGAWIGQDGTLVPLTTCP